VIRARYGFAFERVEFSREMFYSTNSVFDRRGSRGKTYRHSRAGRIEDAYGLVGQLSA
jgi:hypothetical protein